MFLLLFHPNLLPVHDDDALVVASYALSLHVEARRIVVDGVCGGRIDVTSELRSHDSVIRAVFFDTLRLLSWLLEQKILRGWCSSTGQGCLAGYFCYPTCRRNLAGGATLGNGWGKEKVPKV